MFWRCFRGFVVYGRSVGHGLHHCRVVGLQNLKARGRDLGRSRIASQSWYNIYE